jgi:hypothetical protein
VKRILQLTDPHYLIQKKKNTIHIINKSFEVVRREMAAKVRSELSDSLTALQH